MNPDYSTSINEKNSSCAIEALLKQLHATRRMISLYPPGHPQIRTSVNRTLAILSQLWDESRLLTLGIAPTKIYFNNRQVEGHEPTNRELAHFFFHIGVASISFQKGLDAQELIRFYRLLPNQEDLSSQQESFAALLEKEKIFNISVKMVDYASFREKTPGSAPGQNTDDRLWEDFLQKLHNGAIETADYLEPEHQEEVVGLFSRKLSGTAVEKEQAAAGLGRLLSFDYSKQQPVNSLRNYDKKINMLLERLNPETRNNFLRKGLENLESGQQSNLQQALKRVSPGFLEAMVAHSARLNSALSPRLLNLINSLSATTEPQPPPAARSFSAEETRLRVDILFKEEQTDLYIPTGYQQALRSAVASKLPGTLPAEDREALNDMISSQSVEGHTARIIFERLLACPDAQAATTYQNHLLDFSRMFLEAGDYAALRSIYQHWMRFISQNDNPIELLAEKLAAYHTQASFMAEVLDGFDLWEADRHQELINYVVLVGDPYCESIVERLGLARHYSERQRWIDLLTRISGNAQQIIIPFLTDARWYLVRNLVMILGSEPTPAGVRAVRPLCQHPHPQVRAEAIRVLFSCNSATANRLLLKELHSAEEPACLAAVGIAYLSDDPEVLAYLHRRLDSGPNSADELTLLKAVVITLCRRGEKESLVVMRRILNRGGLLVNRHIRQLQRHTIAALADFQHPAADKLLQELAAGKFRRDAAAARANRQGAL